MIHRTTEMQSKHSTTADFHGYSVPPSSIAVTNNIEAARSVKAPRKSTFRTAFMLKDLSMLSELVDLYGKPAGIVTHNRTRTMTPGGTLRMNQ